MVRNIFADIQRKGKGAEAGADPVCNSILVDFIDKIRHYLKLLNFRRGLKAPDNDGDSVIVVEENFVYANENGLSRRKFLKIGAVISLATVTPGSALAGLRSAGEERRSLSLYNIHTGESLQTVYWADGDYIPGALQAIDVIMRDHRTGDVLAMDPGVLDLIHALKQKLQARGPLHIISGYRSPKTNARLNRCSSGVAKNSFHMYGKAVDIRLPGCRLCRLRDVATALGIGGVGYYPKSRFVHVDIGPVRSW
jgi:uncharacterized protein YcbK (DUF882 family)